MAMAMAARTTSFLSAPSVAPFSKEQPFISRTPQRLRVSANLHKNTRRREFRLHSLSIVPLLALLGGSTKPIIETFNTWALSEQQVKDIYLISGILFCFGCCIAGSMNDPFYDSEEYRREGGDGSVNWLYQKQEREEREAREELFREEMQRELEEKARSLKQVDEKDTERTEELVRGET